MSSPAPDGTPHLGQLGALLLVAVLAGTAPWVGPGAALAAAGLAVGLAGWSLLRPERPRAEPPSQDRLYQAVIDRVGHGVAALDGDGRVLIYNPAAQQILGTMQDLPMGAALAGTLTNGQDLHTRHPKTGRPMWLRVQARPLDDEGTVVVFEDITRRKEAELALAASDARRSAMMRGAPYGVAIVDGALQVVEQNPALRELLRCARPEDVGDALRVATVEGKPLLAALKGDRPVVARPLEIDGRDELYVELTAVPIRAEGGALHALTLQDVTARARAEQLKDAFLSTVSHELRTPLTSLLGALGLIIGGAVGAVPDDAAGLVVIAERNGKRLLSLVNDLLDIQRLSTGRLSVGTEAIDLAAATREAVSANQPYAAQLQVELSVDGAEEPVWVQGDRERLLQVLANLLSNAAKYTPPGAAVRVRLGTEAGPRIEVTDAGPGIAPAFRPRVFERFARGAPPVNPKAGAGTGLGLSITKVLVERMGGAIGFDTAEGQGTTFWFTLAGVDPPRTPPRPGGPQEPPPPG